MDRVGQEQCLEHAGEVIIYACTDPYSDKAFFCQDCILELPHFSKMSNFISIKNIINHQQNLPLQNWPPGIGKEISSILKDSSFKEKKEQLKVKISTFYKQLQSAVLEQIDSSLIAQLQILDQLQFGGEDLIKNYNQMSKINELRNIFVKEQKNNTKQEYLYYLKLNQHSWQETIAELEKIILNQKDTERLFSCDQAELIKTIVTQMINQITFISVDKQQPKMNANQMNNFDNDQEISEALTEIISSYTDQKDQMKNTLNEFKQKLENKKSEIQHFQNTMHQQLQKTEFDIDQNIVSLINHNSRVSQSPENNINNSAFQKSLSQKNEEIQLITNFKSLKINEQSKLITIMRSLVQGQSEQSNLCNQLKIIFELEKFNLNRNTNNKNNTFESLKFISFKSPFINQMNQSQPGFLSMFQNFQNPYQQTQYNDQNNQNQFNIAQSQVFNSPFNQINNLHQPQNIPQNPSQNEDIAFQPQNNSMNQSNSNATSYTDLDSPRSDATVNAYLFKKQQPKIFQNPYLNEDIEFQPQNNLINQQQSMSNNSNDFGSTSSNEKTVNTFKLKQQQQNISQNPYSNEDIGFQPQNNFMNQQQSITNSSSDLNSTNIDQTVMHTFKQPLIQNNQFQNMNNHNQEQANMNQFQQDFNNLNDSTCPNIQISPDNGYPLKQYPTFQCNQDQNIPLFLNNQQPPQQDNNNQHLPIDQSNNNFNQNPENNLPPKPYRFVFSKIINQSQYYSAFNQQQNNEQQEEQKQIYVRQTFGMDCNEQQQIMNSENNQIHQYQQFQENQQECGLQQPFPFYQQQNLVEDKLQQMQEISFYSSSNQSESSLEESQQLSNQNNLIIEFMEESPFLIYSSNSFDPNKFYIMRFKFLNELQSLQNLFIGVIDENQFLIENLSSISNQICRQQINGLNLQAQEQTYPQKQSNFTELEMRLCVNQKKLLFPIHLTTTRSKIKALHQLKQLKITPLS